VNSQVCSAKDPELLDQDFTKTFHTNVIGDAQVIGAFMPWILAGQEKKVIAISSGMGEVDLTRQYDLWIGTSYSVSKAALKMVITKFSALYREQGVIISGVSPGIVNTGFNCKILLANSTF
jgi:NAD(P)-dependent dehydrogenase (short-subunit alcohol dehydrogenase family)